MECPHASGSLMRLPGKNYDDSARKLREQFLAGEIDIEQFLKENAHSFPKTKEARFKKQVQTYALASLVIEDFWKYIKNERFDDILAGIKERHPADSYDEQVKGFSLYCNALIGIFQNRYWKEARERKKSDTLTKADEWFVCYNSISRIRHPTFKGNHFPSSKDLIMILTRVAHAAPVVFERDFGRKPTHKELFALLRHPRMSYFFVELMANDRRSTYPLFAKLEERWRLNLNDAKRAFSPDFFTIVEQDGSFSMELKPSVIEEYRSHFRKSDRRRVKRNAAPSRVLGCPVLYTGLIREMFDWANARFERWMTPT